LEYELKIDNEAEKELEVSVSADEFNTFMDKETDKLRKEIALKGYRKGRAPKSLIKTKFKDTVKVNAINNLIAESYHKILEEKKWTPASPAELLNIEEGEKIKFHLRFEIIPDFGVENYLGLEIFKDEQLPIDFLYEHGEKALREKFASLKEIPGPAVVDNLITMDLEIVEGNQIKDQQTDIIIKVGDRNFPDDFNRTLVGVKKGQKKEVKISEQVYRMIIKKIEEKNLPQIDDEFAKKLNYKDVKELKEEISKKLEKNEEERIEEELKESLAHVILERIHFTTPKVLIEEEYQRILKRNNIPDSDSNKERFWEPAEKRVRLNLILDKIALKEGIKVEDKVIIDMIKTTDIKLSDGNINNVMDYLRIILTRNKTIDFLLRNAKISRKSRIISPKEATDAYRPVRH